MILTSEIINNILVFNIEIKRATSESADLLKERLNKTIKEGKIHIVIDMSSVEFIDSAYLSSLLGALKQVSIQNGDIKLAGLRPGVRYIFHITRLEKIFDIHDSLESAVKSFKKN